MPRTPTSSRAATSALQPRPRPPYSLGKRKPSRLRRPASCTNSRGYSIFSSSISRIRLLGRLFTKSMDSLTTWISSSLSMNSNMGVPPDMKFSVTVILAEGGAGPQQEFQEFRHRAILRAGASGDEYFPGARDTPGNRRIIGFVKITRALLKRNSGNGRPFSPRGAGAQPGAAPFS